MGDKFYRVKEKVKTFAQEKQIKPKAKSLLVKLGLFAKKIKEKGFSKKQTIVISSILIICLLIILWPANRVQSPMKAISLIEESILQANTDEVIRLVKVEDIAQDISITIINQMNNKKVTGDLIAYMQAELKNKAISDFYHIVKNKGNFYQNLEMPNAIISKTLNFLMDKSGEVISRKIISQDSESSVIRIMIFRPELDIEIPVDLKLSYVEESWVLSEVANLNELLVILEEVENKRVEKLNAQIKENFNNIIVLKDFSKSELNVKDNTFLMRLSLENISQENISQVHGTLKLIHNNALIGTVNINIPEMILAKNFYEKAWNIKLTDYESLQRIAATESKEIEAVLDIEKIVFEKGNVITLLK